MSLELPTPCCCFEIIDPLYLPLKRGGPACPHLECPVGGCNTWKNSKRRMYNIVFLCNYAVHLLYGKSWDGYGFYCLMTQPEIDVQSTSNRKLPNFYEKVTDFLWESYRISKWWQNHVFTETFRICHKWRILTRWTMRLFMQTDWLFMQNGLIVYTKTVTRLYYTVCLSMFNRLYSCRLLWRWWGSDIADRLQP